MQNIYTEMQLSTKFYYFQIKTTNFQIYIIQYQLFELLGISMATNLTSKFPLQ